jgi:dihydrofolate reductase
MRRLIAGMKLSLDGMVEGPSGIAEWADAWSEDYGLTAQIDACVLGGAMYRGYEPYWTGIRNEPAKPAWITGSPPTPAEREWSRLATEIPHYVLSRTQTSALWPNTRFIRSVDDVADLKQTPGKDIYLLGGAETASRLIDAGLVDELRLILHPLVAGSGKPLFRVPRSARKFELLSATTLDKGCVSLAYAMR